MNRRNAREFINQRLFETARELYKHNVVSLAGLLKIRQERIEPYMTRKQIKALRKQQAFLEHEIAHLNKVTVNLKTTDLMINAAPDTFLTIKSYLERRGRDLLALEGVKTPRAKPKKSQPEKPKPKKS